MSTLPNLSLLGAHARRAESRASPGSLRSWDLQLGVPARVGTDTPSRCGDDKAAHVEEQLSMLSLSHDELTSIARHVDSFADLLAWLGAVTRLSHSQLREDYVVLQRTMRDTVRAISGRPPECLLDPVAYNQCIPDRLTVPIVMRSVHSVPRALTIARLLDEYVNASRQLGRYAKIALKLEHADATNLDHLFKALSDQLLRHVEHLTLGVVNFMGNDEEKDKAKAALQHLCTAIAGKRLGALSELKVVYDDLDEYDADEDMGNWGMSKLSDAIVSGSLGNLKKLYLSFNYVTVYAMNAFARITASSSGLLDNLTELHLDDCWLDDDAITAFASADGSLVSLTHLSLKKNRIGDEGFSSLLTAIDSGRLGKLQKLNLIDNSIEGLLDSFHRGRQCCRCPVGNLTELYLGSNDIMLSDGIFDSSGLLCNITRLSLNDNLFDAACFMEDLLKAIGNRWLDKLTHLWIHNIDADYYCEESMALLSNAIDSGLLPKLELLCVDEDGIAPLKQACLRRNIELTTSEVAFPRPKDR